MSGSSAFASVDGRPRFAFAASSSFFCLVVLFCVCVWCVGCVEWAGWEKDRIEERDRERVRASGCACVGARVRGSAGACVRVRTCVGSWVAGWVRECACARFAHSHTRDFCMIWGLVCTTHRQRVRCFGVGCAVRTKHGILANVSQLECVSPNGVLLCFLGRFALLRQAHMQNTE